MLASPADLDLAKTAAEAAEQEVVPVETEATVEAQATAEGPLPEPNTAMAEQNQMTASEQAFGTERIEPGHVPDGMYTPEQYKAATEAAGCPEKWSDEYWRGHTEATQWEMPEDRRSSNHFDLKKNQSASQAVKDFIKGPTIGDWRVAAVAIEMKDLIGQIGDRRFDQLFGSAVESEDARIAPAQRLQITSAMYTIPFYNQMWAYAQESNAVDRQPEEPEQPAVAAGIEEKPETQLVSHPAPALVADELGMQREQEFA